MVQFGIGTADRPFNTRTLRDGGGRESLAFGRGEIRVATAVGLLIEVELAFFEGDAGQESITAAEHLARRIQGRAEDEHGEILGTAGLGDGDGQFFDIEDNLVVALLGDDELGIRRVMVLQRLIVHAVAFGIVPEMVAIVERALFITLSIGRNPAVLGNQELKFTGEEFTRPGKATVFAFNGRHFGSFGLVPAGLRSAADQVEDAGLGFEGRDFDGHLVGNHVFHFRTFDCSVDADVQFCTFIILQAEVLFGDLAQFLRRARE